MIGASHIYFRELAVSPDTLRHVAFPVCDQYNISNWVRSALSMYAMLHPKRWESVFSMHLWKVAGAFLRPKDIRLNAKFPKWNKRLSSPASLLTGAPCKTLCLNPVLIAMLHLPHGFNGPQCRASERGR